jgi:hypothetical protein
LLREEATSMARDLAAVIGLAPRDSDGDEGQLRQAAERLRAAGYAVRGDSDFRMMAERRSQYVSSVKAIADHLGKPGAVLVRQE